VEWVGTRESEKSRKFSRSQMGSLSSRAHRVVVDVRPPTRSVASVTSGWEK